MALKKNRIYEFSGPSQEQTVFLDVSNRRPSSLQRGSKNTMIINDCVGELSTAACRRGRFSANSRWSIFWELDSERDLEFKQIRVKVITHSHKSPRYVALGVPSSDRRRFTPFGDWEDS